MTVQLQPPSRVVNSLQAPSKALEFGASQPVNQQSNAVDSGQPQFNNFDLQQLFQQQITEFPTAPTLPQPITAGVHGVDQYMQQFAVTAPDMPEQPQIIRRNLTVAEMLVVFLLSCFFVGGIQLVWGYLPKPVVSIEWKR